jgi:hypothetical protein
MMMLECSKEDEPGEMTIWFCRRCSGFLKATTTWFVEFVCFTQKRKDPMGIFARWKVKTGVEEITGIYSQ